MPTQIAPRTTGYVQTPAYLLPDRLDHLRAYAAADDRSVAYVLREAVDQYIATREADRVVKAA